MGIYEKSADSRNNPASPLAALDELSPLENDLLKPLVNSPVHEEASLKAVIEQTSLHNALIKSMQLCIDEGDWNLQRSKQYNDSPPARTELFRKIFRDKGVEEVVSSKATWPKQLKTAAYVRCNLRELMQREEVEDNMDENFNALRTSYTPSKPRSKELTCLEELARNLVGKQYDTKEEDSLGDHGTPTRVELGIAKLEHGEVPVHGVSQEDTKTESNITPRNQLIAESTIQGVQVQKGRIPRMASLRQNHVHSSCLGESCRNADAKEESDSLIQGKASLLDPGEFVIPHDFCNDSALVREPKMDWGTDRDDLEVLLQFLTMKQQLKENKKADVEVVVQIEAIIRELLARMKLVSDCSSSDDGYGERGRNEQIRRVNTNDATMHNVLARLTFKDNIDPEVTVHQNQNIDCHSRTAIRRPPFVVPSSSKSQFSQRMAGSTSTETTPCVRNYINQYEEPKVAKSPSRNLEEAKRLRRSTVSERQPKSCRTIQSIVENAIDVGSEEVNSVGSHGNVVEGGPLTITGTGNVDGTSGAIQVLGSIEHGGISTETGDAIPLVSARNLANRARNAPAMTPWNYQREKQLPIGRSLQIASPNKRSIPSSPTSPDDRRQCRDSPTRRSSPNNRPSPLSSPQGQQKSRPATTTSKSTAAQLRSPKRPSPLSSPQRHQNQLSSPQRQQKPRPAMGTLISTVAHVGSPKPSKTLFKEADHMLSTTVISKPGSHDPDIFPAGISKAVVQESIALAKDSSDPYVDFRDSMLEMMQEKNLWQRQEELQDLLQCFLHLNQPVHHQLIHQAFSDVVSCSSPVSYPHKGLRKERSNAHFSRRSSPSRQLNYEVSQPCKSPVRGGW